MATYDLGRTADGSSSTTTTADEKIVSAATTGSIGGKVLTATARVWVASTSTIAKAIIYSNSGGVPGSLLAVSDELSITNTSESANTFTFSGANQIVLSPSTQYWIGIIYQDPGSTNFVYSRANTTGQIKKNADTYSDGPTSTYGSTSNVNGPLDIYVTYENTPPTVSLGSPADGGSTSDTTPDLTFTGTDGESNDVRYNVRVHKVVATDNFNRADNSNTGMNLGANWESSVPQDDLGVSSNQAYQTANVDDNVAFWNANTFANNQYSKAILVNASGVSGVVVRCSATDWVLAQGGASGCTIYWYNGGAYTLIASSATTFANGDIIGLEVVGTTYYLYKNGVLVVSGTDGSAPSSGKAGIMLEATASRLDDWEGGDIIIDAVSGTDAGFSGSPDNSDPFASAQAVTYTVQSALAVGTYYWKARGIDPSGTNTYGAWSTTRSFTVISVTAYTIQKDLAYSVKPTVSLTKGLAYTVITTPSTITKALAYAVRLSPTLTKALEYVVKFAPTITKSLQYTVKTTPASITKDLAYQVKISQSLTKALQYAVITTPSALTKSLGYSILQAISVTKGLAYAVLTTPTAISKALAYAVAGVTTVTKTLAYTVKSPLTITKGLGYAIVSATAINKGLSYAVATSTTIQKGLQYSVLTAATVTKGLAYSVLKASSITKELGYSIVKDQTIQKALAYAVVTATTVTIQKGLAYEVRTVQTIQKGLSYTVKGSIAISKGLSYRVVAGQTILKSLSYLILKTQSAIQLELSYVIKSSPTISKSLAYDVRITGTITKPMAYMVSGLSYPRAGLSNQAGVLYNVASGGLYDMRSSLATVKAGLSDLKT